MFKTWLILGSFSGLLIYLYMSFGTGSLENSPIVRVSEGEVEGVVELSRGGQAFYAYRGIPFAKPPVGDLRFKDPQPPEKWTGVRRAHTLAPVCIQVDMVVMYMKGQEDCLYLNVYVPKGARKTAPLPVLVWIHGGIFMYGGTDFSGPRYIMDNGVILVTVAYRLGSFGFLNTGDGLVRGNMGLKDQVQALKWVKNNIAAFGGNPELVTIMGESAGASSVHLHFLSPMSKDLYQKAISQSGTAISPFVLSRHPAEQAKRLGERLNCPKEPSTELVKCLKRLTAEQIAECHGETTDLLHEKMAVFSPTIETIDDESSFLTKDPMELLREGKIVNKVPWISGVNSEEGLIVASTLVQNATMLNALEKEWNEVVPRFLFYGRNDNVSKAVRKQYFGKTKKIGVPENLHKITLMFTDRSFFWPISEAATLQAKISPVYLYYYAYSGGFSFAHFIPLFRNRFHYIVEIILDKIMQYINTNILWTRHHNYGCCHSDQLMLQFNIPIYDVTSKDGEDYRMSRDILRLWTDFAKDKKDLVFRGSKWLPVGATNKPLKYFMIDLSYGPIDEPFQNRIKYWKENYVT